MTDPRIEAAARAMCEYAHQCEGEPVQWNEIKEASKATARRFALIALEAADAAAWRPTRTPPDAGIYVHIASSAETGSEQAIALWDYDIGCWRNPDMGMRYASAYFSQWQPLLNPPNATQQTASESITITEVRNDRPIEAKSMLT